MTNQKVVWIVQLDPSFKKRFEDLATKQGDRSYGNGARLLKKIVEEQLAKMEIVKEE